MPDSAVPTESVTTPPIEVFQGVTRGKWHHVWWPAQLEYPGSRLINHAGIAYEPEHPRRPRDQVSPADLCRTCFRPAGDA